MPLVMCNDRIMEVLQPRHTPLLKQHYPSTIMRSIEVPRRRYRCSRGPISPYSTLTGDHPQGLNLRGAAVLLYVPEAEAAPDSRDDAQVQGPHMTMALLMMSYPLIESTDKNGSTYVDLPKVEVTCEGDTMLPDAVDKPEVVRDAEREPSWDPVMHITWHAPMRTMKFSDKLLKYSMVLGELKITDVCVYMEQLMS
ncbi:hypothetical protein P153DRAFT_383481 [Dothidotthia symphoricarpi CBS 119687]|uniref:Uncharacterized protein n=1 Tax=Dothidotthia symphoricarpi CBS 119687 TaxID=1392245 RepID=A0A6A6AHU0_9PLEO|nr:uncharacterized protein P153DRAFT_383481 [Dothidotthia symphoricarpi CBS 119687]KAF2131370.1 hypothetical protein P153DRAFT_383481 [Dothidotthia symphoricarpi CBS 119687]